jgi:hypothetical protein
MRVSSAARGSVTRPRMARLEKAARRTLPPATARVRSARAIGARPRTWHPTSAVLRGGPPGAAPSRRRGPFALAIFLIARPKGGPIGNAGACRPRLGSRRTLGMACRRIRRPTRGEQADVGGSLRLTPHCPS